MSKTPKLEQFLTNTNQEIDNDYIFHHYISSNQEDFKEFNQSKNPQQSLCGAHVPQQTLSFQCFDCAPDPHHMYCGNCFQLELHQNHRAFFKKEANGCCDCGDPTAIANRDSFCKLHKEQKIDITQEISKVKPNLREAILRFLKDSFQIYFSKCEEGLSLVSNIPNPFLLQCRHISHIINYKQVYKLLNNHYNIGNIYQTILSSIRISDIIIDFLCWLCKDRTCFALLIAGFLKSQYTDGVTYFEQIIHYQQLKIFLDFENDSKFDKLLYNLNIDENFRLFTQEVFLTRQDDLWKSFEIETFDGAVIIEEFISSFENFVQTGVFYTKEKNQLLLFENYFKKLNTCKEKYIAYTIKAAKFFSMQSQFVSEEFQDIQFTSPKIKNLLDMNTKLQNILNTCQLGNLDDCYSMLEFFSLKFQYNYFIKSFNNTLSQLFQNYQTQQLTIEEIASLNPEQFFLTALFKSQSHTKGFSNSNKLYQPLISETQIQLNLLYLESRYLNIMKQCLAKYLASPQTTTVAKSNFINILFYWSYELIRTNKNNKEQYNYLPEFYKNNIQTNTEKDQQNTIIRLNYCIYRSGSIIDKYFIILLTYLFQQNEFQSSNQFRKYLQTTLKQDEQELQFNLSNIFERCVHNFISLLYTPLHEQVSNTYFTIGKEQPESYDIAFIKFYFILYKDQALSQMRSIIQSRQYFKDYSQNQYFIQIIARIIASDKSFSCVCQALYSQTNLPEGMSFTLFQILSNLFILNHYQEYSEIKSTFEQASFSVSNLEMYILNFCELDEDLNKLKLKTHQQIQQYFKMQPSNQTDNPNNHTYFHPLLFLNHQSTAQSIGEHLTSQKRSDYFIQFGNSIEQLRDFGQLKGVNLELMEFFALDTNINLIISEIQPSLNSATEIKLIERLINISAYLKKETLQIQESLKQLQMSKEQDQQSIQLILNKYGSPKQVLEEEAEVLQLKSLQSVKMNKMKAKFKQKIESFQQNDIAATDNQKDVQLQHDTCALCRLDLEDNQNNCIPILIQSSPYSKYYPIYPADLRNDIMKDELNLLKISIVSCKHKFHDKCLIATYSYSQKQKLLPLWFQLQCPVCKQASETRLSINKNKSNEQYDEFNNWLLIQSQNFGIKNYLKEKYGESIEHKLKEIYLSLLVDLLLQLFMDSLEFIRQDKHFVFLNILDFLFQISKNITINRFEFQNQQSIFLNILNLIIELLILNNQQQKSLAQFLENNQNQIKSQIFQFDLPFQITNELLKCFAINIEKEQNQIVQVNQYIEQFNRHVMINIVKNQITDKLGYKFKQFYDHYFNEPCSFCKGFSNASKSSDQFVCLLCFQKVCDVECKKLFSKNGNMNVHAQLYHQGNTIFASLKTGQLALLSSPLTCFGYKNLYQNKFGQLIKITNMETQWEDYYINNKVLTDTAEIMISNSLKQIIKNHKLNYNQLDLRGFF
ncbi:unnamed protein product (macronuclear) [Paramecium tetraurelia]|uniref:RING-type E3 ubiquitin transferase n=1 Tax=Paramecium tetraurelia TaxID=5888 RepID=A0CE98_PARTE|nr:uncharacterized protein GSPATT00037551001 [Paramecium tetraurelia]CAK69115.1 unnamed protein product [Paramecium tetraurelia]|eukprot:XP_001436512.1 hypothetical protein (macronuclear) [Paramecium tetraurelia strain d4-2]